MGLPFQLKVSNVLPEKVSAPFSWNEELEYNK